MPYKDPEKAREAARKRTAKWRKDHPEYKLTMRLIMRKLRAKDPNYGRKPEILSLDDPKVVRELEDQSYQAWREARRR